MKSCQTLLLATALAAKTYAWGSLGHQTVAYLAQHYVSQHTAQWAQAILNDTSSSYLANIATWADSYRHTAEGEFSAAFHYIDALDTPPASCNVDYERDCGSAGCIVSAIANYTQRVQSPAELDALQVNYALRWIVHFTGDIAQPLHDENYEIGGNGIDVTFDGDETNLHAAWDTSIPEQLRGGYGLVEAAEWASDLAASIHNGTYSKVAASWLEGIDVEDPISTAMVWARDGNSYVCSVVLPNGGESYNGTELYPAYYESAVSTVEQQIAKAGYRLAAWLNAIAEKQTPGTYRRAIGQPRHTEVKRDLSGRDLLPKSPGLTIAQRERLAKRGDLGCGCSH
ncbi:putative S1/P1 nuclease, phospholipase C/P1 nuclease domain superfamily [Septoria linicola]|nr:putative S1/P1 nuclease, phospholipase C/P1 nuclease domain superfamily [Septoria linicola]